MSLHEYQISKELSALDVPFYALIMAAMRQADTNNTLILRRSWPRLWAEMGERYNAVGGVLAGEETDERRTSNRRDGTGTAGIDEMRSGIDRRG